MSEDPPRIDPISAEHLIRDARSGSPADAEPLAGLLAAAAAPARDEELAGEEDAVAAFRKARLALAPQSRRRVMLKSVLVKAAVLASVAVVGGGGVALAASTGHLPGTGSPHEHATAPPTHGATAAPRATAREHASRPASTGTHHQAASRDARPNASPSPDLRGLCTAFRAHAGDNPGKALESPAFKVLVERAGGKDKVAAYCTTLLATPAGKASAHRNDASTHAASHPTGHPKRTRSRPSHPAPSSTNTHIP